MVSCAWGGAPTGSATISSARAASSTCRGAIPWSSSANSLMARRVTGRGLSVARRPRPRQAPSASVPSASGADEADERLGDRDRDGAGAPRPAAAQVVPGALDGQERRARRDELPGRLQLVQRAERVARAGAEERGRPELGEVRGPERARAARRGQPGSPPPKTPP